jgi:hypothetical protein
VERCSSDSKIPIPITRPFSFAGLRRVPATRSDARCCQKQRNKHLQTTLIEAAKIAPRNSPDLAMLYDKEKQKGNANRATLAVARKLVAYLKAVDRRQRDFQVVETKSRCDVAFRPRHGAAKSVSPAATPQSVLGTGNPSVAACLPSSCQLAVGVAALLCC